MVAVAFHDSPFDKKLMTAAEALSVSTLDT